VRSSTRASGAFCITEVIPFFTLVADVQVSLLPIGSPLAAFRMKYCWPFFASFFSKRFSFAAFFFTASLRFVLCLVLKDHPNCSFPYFW